MTMPTLNQQEADARAIRYQLYAQAAYANAMAGRALIIDACPYYSHGEYKAQCAIIAMFATLGARYSRLARTAMGLEPS